MLEWTVGELNAILESNLVPNHNGRGQLAGLHGDSCTLPEQSECGRIFQHQDRL
jgi:hypothetical protein